MAAWACHQNVVILSMLFLAFILLTSSAGVAKKEGGDEFRRKNTINDDKPFRMSKINLIWEKAKKNIAVDELPNLYAELVVHDRLEVEWKQHKADGQDEDGEQEALIRRKLLAILEKYNLREIYPVDNSRSSINADADDPDTVFQQAITKDKRLAKIWQKAESSGFSAKEMETLKAEFRHHLDKVDEYNQLKLELDRLDGIHENSIERFKSGEDHHANVKEKHSALKEGWRDLRRSYESLEQLAEQGPNDDHPWIKDPRIRELWSLAVRSNLSESELVSFREELSHFEKKIRKHEYYQKEAEVSRANFHMQGAKDSNDIPEFHQKLEDRVKDYSQKVKKWYTELKSRLLKPRVVHQDL